MSNTNKKKTRSSRPTRPTKPAKSVRPAEPFPRPHIERRKAIAAAVKAGEMIQDIAIRFGVNLSTVRNACLAEGVETERDKRPTLEMALRAIMLRREGKTLQQIGDELNVSKQRISKVLQIADKVGFK